MNPLAQELNEVLTGTVVSRLLSELGQRLYFPKGIVSQSAEAGARAHRLNATIGMAVEDNEPMVLPLVARQLPGLTRKELASYAPTGGIPALREAWKKQLLAKNPRLAEGTFSSPMVVPGLTNGVFQATELFVNPGDVVIIPDMFWGNYRLIMEVRRGAKIVTFPFFNQEGGLNLAGLKSTIQANKSSGKVIICLNFPNNPTGYTPYEAEMEGLTSLLVAEADAGTDFLVICDDAYFGLFFEEGVCTESLFARLATAHERILAFKVDGATKEDFVWGFRVGFMTVAAKGLQANHYDALQKKMMGAIRGNVSSSSGLGQHIILKAFQDPAYAEQKQGKFKELEKRYFKVKALVDAMAAAKDFPFEVLPFNSGYFMSFRCKGFSAEALRLRLLDDGIGTISIGEDYLRVAYSSVDLDRLEELYGEILKKARELAKGNA